MPSTKRSGIGRTPLTSQEEVMEREVQLPHAPRTPSRSRDLARWILASLLIGAGASHLTVARDEFKAQVPNFVPLDPDITVLGSGVVEIALGTMLLTARKRRGAVGLVVALFFIAVFPGNISQWLNQEDAFGLDTDTKRFMRLFFQPVLVAWAGWSTRDGDIRR